MSALACGMTDECTEPVTYIDDRGWIYCTSHGQSRQSPWQRCRKLRPFELRRLERGDTVKRY